jgi:hypothetical protein
MTFNGTFETNSLKTMTIKCSKLTYTAHQQQYLYDNNDHCEPMCYPLLFPLGESGKSYF